MITEQGWPVGRASEAEL